MKIDTLHEILINSDEGLTFEDVLMIPQQTDAVSRDDISLVNGNKLGLTLPIISANMDTITEVDMAKAMRAEGAIGAIHRFMDEEKFTNILAMLHHEECPAIITIGMSQEDELVEILMESPYSPAAICIDVAHGDSTHMMDKISSVGRRFPVPIIAGNVATPDGALRLIEAGADIIKVGVGGGFCCKTRQVTGHGVPQLSAIKEIARVCRTYHVEVIADGGCKCAGDIIKCFAAGASYVMLGSMLAGHTECPGEIVNTSTGAAKIYRGMASSEAQMSMGKKRAPEGISTTVPLKGDVQHTLLNIAQSIQSGLSYSGCSSLQELPNKALFCKVSRAGYMEGLPFHGANS